MSLNALKLKTNSTTGIINLKRFNNNLIKKSLKNFSTYFSKSSYLNHNNHNQTNFVNDYAKRNKKIFSDSKLQFLKINKCLIHSLNNTVNANDLKNQTTEEENESEDFLNHLNKQNNTSIPKQNIGNKNKANKNKELFGNNDIDSILAEVNEFFQSNSTKNAKSTASQASTEDLMDNSNFGTEETPNLNTNQTKANKKQASSKTQNKNLDNLNESQLLDLNNEKTNLSTLSEFYLSEAGLFEEDTEKADKYEESIFGYKTENIKFPIEEVRKFPFIKKLLIVYKTFFYSQIQRQEYRFFCQNVFTSEELNLENLDEFQAAQPLEIKIAYYIAFQALRGLSPIFLNKNIKNEIFQKLDSRDLNLTDILVFSKLNVLMQDINLMYRICDFLNPIFTKSITEARYHEIVEKNPDNIIFFVNLFVVLMPCQRFLNLILNKYETLYMNIFATLYNLRQYIYTGRDISSLKGLLFILIKSSPNKKINQSELLQKFQSLIDEIVKDYTDNFCSKILQSTQLLNLVNLLTNYYSTIENLDDIMIKKILDINYLSLNLMEKYSEEALLLIFRSIENFLPFYVNLKDKIVENEELSGILENIIYSYFSIYSPNITISGSKFDFTKIKNLDLIYLIKLKYIFATYFHRKNPEASSYLIAINGLIDNSLNNIKHFPVIYAVMGKCLKYASIYDRKKIFDFYAKNIQTYLNDINFFLFVHNYDMLEKYGNIATIIDDYRAFIIRQLIKMFYFNQVYYIFAKPDKLFYTIMAFCNNTYMTEFDNTESKQLKKYTKKSASEKAKTPKTYKNFEDSYYPTFPKELYRFLNIVFYKIRTDSAIFDIYARRIQTVLSLVKLSYLFEQQLLKENYFSVLYPSINFFGMNYLNVMNYVDDVHQLNLITYYISLLPDNQEMMLYQMKLIAKFVVIVNKFSDSPQKMFFVLKKIEETYLLNPQPYDSLEKNPKNPKFMKLILRIKNRAYMNLKTVEGLNLDFLN